MIDGRFLSNFGAGKLRTLCIVPTYNSAADLARLLDSMDAQTSEFDICIVDSCSTDGTQEIGSSRVENFLSIPASQFNHGGTRQFMVSRNPDYDIYIFLTQDAFLEDTSAIGNLVAHFKDESIGAVCGRQLPHLDANPLAQHARFFNYPADSRVKSLSDAPALGIKTPFMSNSFSAYRGSALLEVGGFPQHVILSEDMYVAAKMLLSGWKVAYASDALCRHSHNYTVREEFCRYFDQGVFHAREPWISEHFGGAEGEGARFVVSELRFLGLRRWYLWPGALWRNCMKLFAYNLGKKESLIPIKIKRKMSMHKRYFDGVCAGIN